MIKSGFASEWLICVLNLVLVGIPSIGMRLGYTIDLHVPFQYIHDTIYSEYTLMTLSQASQHDICLINTEILEVIILNIIINYCARSWSTVEY